VASATMMNTPLTMLDSGEVAFRALGVMGALAVVIAGWTTSNPTLYRAGLALQVVTPGWPRWVVTLIAGAVTTAIACFPFVFRELLNFVGLYGLLLMPVGAIVVAEHWIFPRIGFERFWSTRKGQVLNRPALAAWAISLAAALVCWQAEALGGWLSENVHESLSAVAAIHVHLFYLAGPVWVLTVVLYLVFSAMAGAAGSLPELSEEEAEGRAEEEREEGEISATPTADAVPHAASTSRIYRYFAALALACLASIVLFSYCICVGYMAHDAVLLRIGAWSVDFGGYLVIATGVYFVSGVFWMIGRGKRRGLSAA